MMDSISSVSPSIVLPPKSSNPLQNTHHRQRIITFSSPFLKPSSQFRLSWVRRRCHHHRQVGHRQRIRMDGTAGAGGGEREEDENRRRDEELERALHMDGTIPGSSNEFVKQVSSRAYNMRSNLQQTFDSSSYDVLEANPWRESSKPVYVLTHAENQLCTMKTRRNRSEVERELGLLFSKGSKWRNQAKPSGNGSKFQMLVEDIRECVLVFEDQNEAAKYCDLLQGGGQDCEGVAEIDASSVFDLCRKMRALAVLFRRGRTPPLPESLKLNLRARKRSLEDQVDI
ncbi:OLC1v1032721C1 [Oldenlandia corymbosa var. corymbosa]|uniref:OLC1v1032721C1 n=1 Tax=Oldenlandia corymbosa var. corymbosa TaxID=529605 RepID=A0AAV1CLH1_OLDCO|nr:OLC1v1032721C1 [Oldenlandia corymbosa var. corymbosa]